MMDANAEQGTYKVTIGRGGHVAGVQRDLSFVDAVKLQQREFEADANYVTITRISPALTR